MSVPEKIATVAKITELCKELGVKAELPSEKKGGYKKKARGASSKPYWMRTATGIDKKAKGMFQIEGDWVNTVADVAEGSLIVLGVKGDEKSYHLLKSSAGDTFRFEDWSGNEVSMSGCKQLKTSPTFGVIKSEVERLAA
tara:strand:- start:871 stop:1290 length:420 start_codon:yes stop_codon:yes gene_type:complete